MRLTLTQLQQCTVETISGVVLGKAYDLVLESDGQLVAQYVVKPHRWSGTVYTIGRDQIVRFEKEKIIVDDAVVTVTNVRTSNREPFPDPNPVAMREES